MPLPDVRGSHAPRRGHGQGSAAYPAAVSTTMSRAGAGVLAGHHKAVPLSGVALGIDVGGTGVKAAMVDLATAQLVTSRVREKTPQPSTPANVLETIAVVVERVLAEHSPVSDLPIGCGLPGAIMHGVMKTAANVDAGWIDYDATTHISERLGRPVLVINDADAAGMAELAFGEARDQPGTVILLTVGTGIGSALISDGRLVPNTELGHLIMRTKISEALVSGAAKVRRGLGWKTWAREFNQYLAMIEFFFWPDRIIIGGGLSKESSRYWPYLKTQAELVKATHLNTSGIIGAAYAAALAAHATSTEAASLATSDKAKSPDSKAAPDAKADSGARSARPARKGRTAKPPVKPLADRAAKGG
jgi:polyphosphate glucokinase